jgi:hypothetical protein
MACGVNGFRAWTDTSKPPNFVKCPCGYAGLPHYAHRDHVKVVRGKPAWLRMSCEQLQMSRGRMR